MSHESIEALVPAYAIGAVDVDEKATVEAHLRACDECRALYDDFKSLDDELLYAIPVHPAPAHLADGLARHLAPPAAPANARARVHWPSPRLPVLAGLAAAALALLLITNVYWYTRSARMEEELAARATAIAALAGAPAVELQGDEIAPEARAVLYFREYSQVAVLRAYDLPGLPPDRAYQVWLIRDGQRDSGGLFRVDEAGEGLLLINSPRPLSDYQAIGVTEEPAGGSPGPTSPRVMGAALQPG